MCGQCAPEDIIEDCPCLPVKASWGCNWRLFVLPKRSLSFCSKCDTAFWLWAFWYLKNTEGIKYGSNIGPIFAVRLLLLALTQTRTLITGGLPQLSGCCRPAQWLVFSTTAMNNFGGWGHVMIECLPGTAEASFLRLIVMKTKEIIPDFRASMKTHQQHSMTLLSESWVVRKGWPGSRVSNPLYGEDKLSPSGWR